jgi:hypothetical protein
MERQLGTLVAERPQPAGIEVIEDVAAPQPAAHPRLRLWAWRALIAIAVLVALAGMFAWPSSLPT